MKRMAWMTGLGIAAMGLAGDAGAVETKKAAQAGTSQQEAKEPAQAGTTKQKGKEPAQAGTTKQEGKEPAKAGAAKQAGEEPAKAGTTKQEPKPADKPPEETVVKPAAVSTMEAGELAEFEKLPERVQKVIQAALVLTTKNLTYLYASHDPAKGGMDCSGAVYRVLMDEKVAGVPRQSDEMCGWVQKKGAFVRTEGVTKLDDDRFAKLVPGDLLFWSRKGGVEPGRVIPVTHVMLYMGRRASDGKPVIYGSSDGRSYAGQRRCGVSVFDFSLPKADDPRVEFYGYGSIPGLLKVEVRKAEAAKPEPAKKPEPVPAKKKAKKKG